jgi:hypothetical protein
MLAAARPKVRRVRLAALALVAALLLVHLAGIVYMRIATPPPAPVSLPPIADPRPRTVYVVAWGYHSSIILEQPVEWRLGPEGKETKPWVEYGWGDRSYYMESNYAPHALLATLLWPTESVVYVNAHDEPPTTWGAGGEIFVRELAPEELRRLASVLEGEFVREADGSRPPAFPPVEGYGGRFYPGRGLYTYWANCNTWTVEKLQESGFRASPLLVIFKSQVGARLSDFRRVEAGR